MPSPLRQAIIICLRHATPWDANQPAALAGVDLSRARAMLTRMHRDGWIDKTDKEQWVANVKSDEWARQETKTKAGGHSKAYLARRDAHDTLRGDEFARSRGDGDDYEMVAADACPIPGGMIVDGYTTPGEIANLVRVTPEAVRIWIRAGKFAGAVKLCDSRNGSIRVPVADLVQFIESRKVSNGNHQ